MTDRRILYAVLVSLMLSACATTPVPTASAPNVPPSRVISTSFLEKKEGFGQVIMKRDAGLSASACNTRIFANASPVAEIAPGEKVVFYLPEGAHIVGAIATGICIGGLTETRAIVSKSRPVVFRISYGSSGEFSIQQTAF